jgi:hypothetical protein
MGSGIYLVLLTIIAPYLPQEELGKEFLNKRLNGWMGE